MTCQAFAHIVSLILHNHPRGGHPLSLQPSVESDANSFLSQGSRNVSSVILFLLIFHLCFSHLACTAPYPEPCLAHSLLAALWPRKWVAGASEKLAEILHSTPRAGGLEAWRGHFGASSTPKVSWELGHISQSAPLVGSAPEAAGTARQISLMSEAPALIGALCFAVLPAAFIFNAGKGWVLFLSHCCAFHPG